MKLESTAIDPDVESILESITEGKELLELPEGTPIFCQGAEADAIYFVQTGKVKITARSAQGRKAVLATAGPGDFLGRGCLVGQSVRMSTATTTQSSTVLKVQRRAMLQALGHRPEVSEKMVATLLVHKINMDEDFCDQFFDRRERRLARVLLKLSRYGQNDFLPDTKLSQLSPDALTDVVGTTRSRILDSLDKFKSLGLIDYNADGEIVASTQMMADMVLAAKPSTALRTRVWSRLRKSHPPVAPPFQTIREAERHWKETPYSGIWICNLFDDSPDGHGAILVKMTAGARYPDHQHKGREQFYVIEGDVKVGEDTLYAGDYHRAEALTSHTRVSTEHGCMCIILGYVGSIAAREVSAV